MKQEIKFTKAKVLVLEEGLSNCPEAPKAIRDAFPEAFREEWEDVTLKVVGLRHRSECGNEKNVGVIFTGEDHYMPYNVIFVDIWKGGREGGNPMTQDFIYKQRGNKILRKRQ